MRPRFVKIGNPTRSEGQSMPMQEYTLREQHGLWEVRLNDQLISGQPTQMEALGVAQALAQAGALRGERSKILVGDLDGSPIEFPLIEPKAPSAGK
jgi:hypothetical protein